MTPPAILTLTRYPDVFARLQQSIDRFEPAAEKIVVTSGEANEQLQVVPGWTVVPGIEPFVFARNVNLGLQVAGERDVLLINDDCELRSPVLATLARLVERYQPGILSPQIDGGVGNALQHRYARYDDFYVSRERLAFVCVYLPWTTRERVGPMDERFTEYGADDSDYCLRTQAVGLSLGITAHVIVRHGGFDGRRASTSFLRQMSESDRIAAMSRMDQLLEAKHGGQT